MAEMRKGFALGRYMEAREWGPALVCSVRGCGRSAWGGSDGMCVDCAAMDARYEQYFAEEQRMRRKKIAQRLSDAAWVLGFGALFALVLFEFLPYIKATGQLWFGGK